MNKIYLTGATSFSGFHIAKNILSMGFDVSISLSKEFRLYEGSYKKRLEILKPDVKIFENSPFGSNSFLNSLEISSPNILSLHHAKVGNFKSPDFSAKDAITNNTKNLDEIIKSGIFDKIKAVILTRSVFEKGVGFSDKFADVGEYGKSKSETYKIFQDKLKGKVALYSFGITNPFGILEEKRLPNYLVECWKNGFEPNLRSPNQIRDNIPVNFLAKCYSNFVISILNGQQVKNEITPSMQVQTNFEFARLIALYSEKFLQKSNLNVICSPIENQDNSESRILIGKDCISSPNPEELLNFWQNYINYLWNGEIT